MPKKKNSAPEKQPTLTPDQEYTHLCALLGERQQLIMSLSVEISSLYSKIQTLKQLPGASV